MKKLLIISASIFVMTACNSMQEARNASAKGVANTYSCAQINSAFTAYDADKTSFTALADIAKMSGLTLENKPTLDVASYYERVKTAANVVLLVQGCTPRS